MRDVAQQAVLRGHHRLQTFSHQIEVAPELRDLVAPLDQFRTNARAEISIREFVRCLAKFPNIRGQVPGQSVAEHTTDQRNHNEPQRQRAEVEAGWRARQTGNVNVAVTQRCYYLLCHDQRGAGNIELRDATLCGAAR